MALASDRKGTRHEVAIGNAEEGFPCEEGQTILRAMIALGRTGIASGCHGGGCGVCKVRIVAGRYRTAPMSRAHVSQKEEEDGVVLACRTYPRTNIRVEVLGKLAKTIGRKRYGLV